MRAKKPLTLERLLKGKESSLCITNEEILVHSGSVTGNKVEARIIVEFDVSGHHFEYNDVIEVELEETKTAELIRKAGL